VISSTACALDGWTCDFLAARRPGFQDGFNSRMGLGPIETIGHFGPQDGLKEMLFTTRIAFRRWLQRNGFGWVRPSGGVARKLHQYLPDYGHEVRRRWPNVQAVTEDEFGELFRKQFTITTSSTTASWSVAAALADPIRISRSIGYEQGSDWP